MYATRHPPTSNLLRLALGVVALVAPAGAARAVDPLELAREGRCAAAMPLLEARLRTAPDDVPSLAALGRCQIRQGEPAAETLRHAARLAPDDADLALDLGIAEFDRGDLEASSSALGDARRLGSQRAELPLYEGLIALGRAEADADAGQAAANLEMARRLDPVGVEPVASYYAGLARSQQGEREVARAHLQRVVDEWPGTPWAESAEEALASLDVLSPTRFASLRLGLAYDDNAVLAGRGVQLPQEIPGEEDMLFTWLAQAGGQLWQDGPWSAGGLLSWAGTAYQDLDDFNVQYPNAALWLDRELGPSWIARLRLVGGYAWVGGDPYLATHGARLSLFRSWDNGGLTWIFAELYRDNYLFSNDDVPDALPVGICPPGIVVCSPIGVDESRARNRDGNGWIGGIEHRIPLPNLLGEIWGGYRLVHFTARGTDFSFNANEFRLMGLFALPAEFSFETGGEFIYRPYRHPSSFPDTDVIVAGVPYPLSGRDRRDKTWRALAAVNRPIWRNLLWELRWTYERNQSNRDVFDYERHVVGTYFTIGFEN
jgi:tetratricopeptide (TPR) repeat protein